MMGATHFLDIGPLPDAKRPGVTHELEVFENGGELFLRATITPPAGDLQAFTATGDPYTGKIEASIKLTREQMKSIEEALEGARTRLAY